MSFKEQFLMQMGICKHTPDGLHYNILDGEIYIKGFQKNAFFKEIPAHIENMPVVSLEGLQESPLQREVIIPDTVRIIRDMCFEFNKQVTKFVIPESVTKIGEHAFAFCDMLEKIIFPDNLETLPLGGAVENCPALKKIHLPEHLKEIPECFAGDCTGLEEIIIPESVTRIHALAFNCCENLKSVKLPSGLTYIGNGAFSGCPMLERPAIPDGCEVHPDAFD